MWIISIFILVVLVLIATVFFYFSSSSPTTGKAIDQPLETKKLFDNIVYPDSLQISSSIGESNKETFTVQNLNDETITVSCTFPDFQSYVDSSSCFTYNKDGQFVGQGSVQIEPGQTQEFTISITPTNAKIKKGSSQIIVSITQGEYDGEVDLTAWQDGENPNLNQVKIPVKIFVEK